MKAFGIMSTAVLSLTLGVAAPALAQQEQHDQQEEQRDKPAPDKEKKAQPERTVKPEEKGARPQETNTKPAERRAQPETNSKPEENRTQEQRTQQVRPEQQAQRAGDNERGRIPEERFRTNFGQEHRFRVSHNDYRSHRFEYGGYAFGFVGAWPSDWLYTEDVYVVEINGAYYLCNSMYPGVNIELNIL
jgi:hypothetical protein